jgi:hypothetical protein
VNLINIHAVATTALGVQVFQESPVAEICAKIAATALENLRRELLEAF